MTIILSYTTVKMHGTDVAEWVVEVGGGSKLLTTSVPIAVASYIRRF
jgi:hypothetical protein